jgi:hypothetical protein
MDANQIRAAARTFSGGGVLIPIVLCKPLITSVRNFMRYLLFIRRADDEFAKVAAARGDIK